MTQVFGAGSARKVFMTVAMGLALAGCGQMQLGVFNTKGRIAEQEQSPMSVATFGQTAVELDGVRYLYDYTATGQPMVPHATEDALSEVLVPGEARAPILRIGRADGTPMTQSTKGHSLQVATFLCSEHPEWPRTVLPAAGQSAQSTPDWVADGHWHVVRPCG
ncbi:hypothetical protein [Tropicibacter oceani]|uniref:Lipoprotein n=1 Tax=Tropicibacter oceani TaxID=3058420 RepID=A0ABY8QD54_9RHOB|nr:hypothetical protein [Tropicibacter oceani]WGW02564.1 hypothetical protein QF118_11475 [Tropicibacter oceani]